MGEEVEDEKAEESEERYQMDGSLGFGAKSCHLLRLGLVGLLINSGTTSGDLAMDLELRVGRSQ